MSALNGQCEHFKNLFYCKDDCDDIDCPCTERLLNEESIIACRAYDLCRHKQCLDIPVRINPPKETDYIVIDGLRIKQIVINKKIIKLKKGFWDIYIMYIFEYNLIFRDKNDCEIKFIRSSCTFNQKVTLYGSICPNYVIGTDMFSSNGHTFKSKPFALVYAKAIMLKNRVNLLEQSNHENMKIFIGLFAEVSLSRIVNLLIKSEGVCVSDSHN